MKIQSDLADVFLCWSEFDWLMIKSILCKIIHLVWSSPSCKLLALSNRLKLLFWNNWICRRFGVMNKTRNGCSYFDISGTPSAERRIIGSCLVIIFLAVISLNSLLLSKLYSIRKKARGDWLFILLSISDLCVGILSVPNLFLKILNFEGITKFTIPCLAFINLSYFPVSLSWILGTTVALDRCFIVLYDVRYEFWVTRKRLFLVVFFMIISDIAVTVTATLINDYRISQFVSMLFQIWCIFLLICLYMRLVWFVYFKKRKMKESINQSQKNTGNLTRTIIYIFICQLICNLPFTVNLVVFRINRQYEKREIENRMNYWASALGFCNSFLNSVILMSNASFKNRINERRRKDVSLRKNKIHRKETEI